LFGRVVEQVAAVDQALRAVVVGQPVDGVAEPLHAEQRLRPPVRVTRRRVRGQHRGEVAQQPVGGRLGQPVGDDERQVPGTVAQAAAGEQRRDQRVEVERLVLQLEGTTGGGDEVRPLLPDRRLERVEPADGHPEDVLPGPCGRHRGVPP
jgi:hypothetical protein